MAGGLSMTANPTGATPVNEIMESFRRCMREADALIRERRYSEAAQRIAEARRLEPTNPYAIAFEERIASAEKERERLEQGVAGVQDVAIAQEEPAPALELQPESDAGLREALKTEIRQEIEAEYRAKFMQELRKEETLALSALESERAKLAEERSNLQQQYEQRVAEMQQRMESEYQTRFDEEVGNIEVRLKSQFQKEQQFIEQELKEQLMRHHESELQHSQTQWKREHEELADQERQAFAERERAMKEQFDRQLLDGLRKTENLFREQSRQQQQFEEQKMRDTMTAQFETTIADEREKVKQQYDILKTELEKNYHSEQEKLKADYQRQLGEQLELRKKEFEEEFENRRQSMIRDLEAELKAKYYSQMTAERDRLQAEASAAIEAEKTRLHREYESSLGAQNANIQKVRSELRREMEQNFLHRLERISQEYDQKMEILGARIPKTTEEAMGIYRENMRKYYATGQPSVEDAKRLMRLKEMLELTFDAHLAVEADVRMALYVEQLEKKILAGELSPGNMEKLQELKNQFSISNEEAVRLEPYILSSFQRFAVKGRILLVDDDLTLLSTLEHELHDYGFQVFACSNVEDAIQKARTTSVDVILSDIKFPEGELDGFKFFKLVQEEPHLRRLPFIFMSSLQDGVIVRSGIQLGIDDYITKPLDMDLVVAVLEGKLKRYRELNRA